MYRKWVVRGGILLTLIVLATFGLSRLDGSNWVVAIQAMATLCLVGVTIFYAFATYQLVGVVRRQGPANVIQANSLSRLLAASNYARTTRINARVENWHEILPTDAALIGEDRQGRLKELQALFDTLDEEVAQEAAYFDDDLAGECIKTASAFQLASQECAILAASIREATAQSEYDEGEVRAAYYTYFRELHSDPEEWDDAWDLSYCKAAVKQVRDFAEVVRVRIVNQ